MGLKFTFTLSEIRMPSLLKPQRMIYSNSHTLISQIVGPEKSFHSDKRKTSATDIQK